jgi:hypothetical protein
MRSRINIAFLLIVLPLELLAQFTPPPLTKTSEGKNSFLISTSEQYGRYANQTQLLKPSDNFALLRAERELLPIKKEGQKPQYPVYYPDPFKVLGSGVSANWFEKILYPYANRSMANQLWGLSNPGRNVFFIQPGSPFALVPALLSPLLKPLGSDGKTQTFGDLNRQSKAWRPRDMERY